MGNDSYTLKNSLQNLGNWLSYSPLKKSTFKAKEKNPPIYCFWEFEHVRRIKIGINVIIYHELVA